MIIHVVERGETIESIARMYGIPVSKLIQDNSLTSSQLAVGQAIVIAYPEQVYTVQEGDTLAIIAQSYQTTVLQLVRNNPGLTDREAIYPGETLVISYDNSRGPIVTNGYTNPFINRDILRGALPYLTYLSVFGYRILPEGNIEDVEDSDVIGMAREYGVAPVMMLSTLTQQGAGDIDIAYQLIYHKEIQDKLINNMLRLLKAKGFIGVNFSFLYLNKDNTKAYEAFTENLSNRLRKEGLLLFITIAPLLTIAGSNIIFEQIDYSEIGARADNIMILGYNWGYNYGPPSPIVSISFTREFLDYITTQIPREKIAVGFPVLGYIWGLPYIIGTSKANVLTIESAIALAAEVGAPIQFDETSQTPNYSFVTDSTGVPKQFVVWYVDVRSVDAFSGLVPEYGLSGVGMWSIIYGLSRIYVVINSQYQIRTLLPVTAFDTLGS